MLYPTELRGRKMIYIIAQAAPQSAREKSKINGFTYCQRISFSTGENRSA